MPVPIDRENSEISDIVKLLESHPATIRSFKTGNLFGMLIGALALIGGFASFLLGLTGSIDWIFKSQSISMRMVNASPGAIFCVIGFIIMLRYKPRVKSEIEIHINESKSADSLGEHKREISVRHTNTASSPISAHSPDFSKNRFPWR